MLDSNLAARQLDVHAAVATRLVRSNFLPHEFLVWLSDPTTALQPPLRFIDPQLCSSMAAVVAPASADASRRLQNRTQSAPSWLGAIGAFMLECQETLDSSFSLRLLATSLLPLYRTLAVGKLHEGFEIAQQRLTESLVLFGLVDELGEDFQQLLTVGWWDELVPAEVLRAELQLDLVFIAHLVRRIAPYFEPATGEFSEAASDLLWSPDKPKPGDDWSAPDLLWRLAGELIAKKSEMVLPRSWIDTPVSWIRVSNHWNSLSHLLLAAECRSGDNSASDHVQQRSAKTEHPAEGAAEVALARLNDALEYESAELPWAHGRRELASNNTEENGSGLMTSSLESGVAIEQSVDGSCTSSDDCGLAKTRSKIIMAEIRSHNDPVFVNVVRRRLAMCRSDGRPICLSHIVVLPDDEAHHNEVCEARENGLAQWQFKLVSWLADHPHVGEPYAFLTTAGELILCVLDLERNEMTSLLRQGLGQVLTGSVRGAAKNLSLSKVNNPAKFHAGISATSTQRSSFTAEELIEPAISCLKAAQHLGTASIKSIEVY